MKNWTKKFNKKKSSNRRSITPGRSPKHVRTPGTNSGSNSGKMPSILRDFLNSLDDEEWKNELYKLLQSQSFNQVEVDLFELLCKVLDQNLFAQVDWARNSFYFRELEVSWAEIYHAHFYFSCSYFSSIFFRGHELSDRECGPSFGADLTDFSDGEKHKFRAVRRPS